MTKPLRWTCPWLAALSPIVIVIAAFGQSPSSQVGREVAIPVHLQDGEEFTSPVEGLIQFGAQLFNAKFTIKEGAGRPWTKGTGATVSDPTSPLVFPRNFDRISSPEANACSGCHNAPVAGAGGDRVTEVFVLAQRFDRLTFDHSDGITTRGAVDESGKFITMDNATNDRKTIGMNGSGFVEMLARQMTAELQAERDATRPGNSRQLTSKGISFGILTHNGDGTWNISQVQGLAAPSLSSKGTTPPSLIIRPLHQVGNVISIRQFSNNAFNHHHGMQAEERFGLNADPDGDGFTDELTTADLTAVSFFQATFSVPARVIPNDAAVERANLMGDAYADLILHDIRAASNPATDPECEPLDQNHPAGSPGFFAGNCRFITRKLWGFYNQGGAFMHRGKFTTAREAVEAHHGEALSQRLAFDALPPDLQNSLIEFLKSLQVLPPGSKTLVVDEHGNPKNWPPPTTGSPEEER